MPTAKKLTSTLRRSGGLTDTNWNRVRDLWLAAVVDRARNAATPKGEPPTYWPAVENACLNVSEALRSGDKADLKKAASAADMVPYTVAVMAATTAAATVAKAAGKAAWWAAGEEFTAVQWADMAAWWAAVAKVAACPCY